MNLVVTGGAGFIRSALLRLMLFSLPTDRVTVLAKLTYAGNLHNLAPVREHPGYRFIQGDICDAEWSMESSQANRLTPSGTLRPSRTWIAAF